MMTGFEQVMMTVHEQAAKMTVYEQVVMMTVYENS